MNIIEIPIGPAVKVFAIQGETGTVLVDTGTANRADHILDTLATHGIAPEDVKLILLTHGHSDHTGSAGELKARTGAPLAIHAGDLGMVNSSAERPAQLTHTVWWLKPLLGLMNSSTTRKPDHDIEPDIVFDAPWRTDKYGVAGEVIPTPGHSAGSSTLLLDSGEAFVGDILMGNFLNPNRLNGPILAVDLDQAWHSLRALLDREPSRIYLSHGKAYDPGDVAKLVRKYLPDD